MTTVATDTNAKQEVIRALTEARNRRFADAEQNTRMEITHAEGLDEDEKQALRKKLLVDNSHVSMPTLIGIRKEMPATTAMALEIFKTDFIVAEEIVGMFDARVSVKNVPSDFKLPYSVQFLEEAKIAGCMLTYQPMLKDGGTIGLDGFAELCKGMSPKGGGELLYADQFDLQKGIVSKKAWFAEKQYSGYRNQQIIQPNVFRIAKKSEISGTSNQRFMKQVMMQCDWIEKSFPKSLSKLMQEAIAEVRRDADMLTKMQDSDSSAFIKQIVKYKFFTLFMETGLETLFRMVAYNQATGEKLLQNMYLRNGVTEPVGSRLGYSGCWDENGPLLGRDGAGYTCSRLGMGFSCIAV